ncbi:MAG TPA: hypothetical protein VG755_21675 [Nannocystaceae bacterium]|nr:hypothetical protein [Nannocystaceae bacterium]
MIASRIFVIVLAFAACSREPEGRFAQAGSEEPPPPTGPLRYASTIASAQKAGDTVTTLVEVASPPIGRMRAIVGVVRGDALAVEIWTFDQRNEAGVLEPTGEPTPGLRLRPSDRKSPALVELRREASAPTAEVHRLLGVAADDPAAAIAAMTPAACTVRASDRVASERLAALEVVARGLDDETLLDDDMLGAALEQLCSGAWTAASTRTLSDRRSEVTTTKGATLELHKQGDGWAIAAIR